MNSSIFHSQPDGDKGTHEVQSTTSKLLRGTDAVPPPQYVEAHLKIWHLQCNMLGCLVDGTNDSPIPSVWCSKYYIFIISCKILCKNHFNLFLLSFYNFTKMKIKRFECPKSVRNYGKKVMNSCLWALICRNFLLFTNLSKNLNEYSTYYSTAVWKNLSILLSNCEQKILNLKIIKLVSTYCTVGLEGCAPHSGR